MRHRLALALALLSCAAAAFAAPTLEYLDSGQWTFNQDVAVQGDLAAVTLSYGVQLWDVSDPAATAFLGDYYTDNERAYGVAWEGDLVAVSTGDGHLYLLDVSDPAHPARIDRLSGVGTGTDLVLVRDGNTRWCYSAGDAANGFQIRDLTTPSAAVLRGSMNLDGKPNSLALLGNVALVCARHVGLYAVDVSNPDAPLLLDTEAVEGTHIGMAADGTRAALASGSGGFTLFDVSNPANPVAHATVSPAAGAWSDLEVQEVVVDGSTLYAVCGDVGVLAYDIGNLDAPVLTGYDPRLDITPPEPIYYVFYEGVLASGKLYLSHWSGITPGVVILDAEASSMNYLGRTLGFDYVRDVDEEEGLVYGCTGHMGVFVHEHVSPSQFVPRGQLPVIESWGVEAHGSTVYIASTSDGLVVGDFSDPDHPLRRGSLDLGQARQLTVQDGVAYVAAYTQGFHTVDVSDPDNLVGLDSALHAGQASVNVDVVSGLAVTADQADGMNVWDVSDPSNIQQLANWPTPNPATDVVLSPDGGLAYLVVTGLGVQVLDLSTPASPVLLSTFGYQGDVGVALVNGYLHVSAGRAGIRTYHQSPSPAAPLELASFNTNQEAKNLCAVQHGNEQYLYVADTSAILVLRLSPDTPVAVSNFALQLAAGGVQVDWMLAETAAAEDLNLTVARESGGEESPVDFAPLDSGLTWRALDQRAELAGDSWRYRLYGRAPGETSWQLLRSDAITLPGTPAAQVVLGSYPNPFNPTTTLTFTLESPGRARLTVYDLAGRRLALLHEGPLAAGQALFAWDGRDEAGHALPSGIYLARLEMAGLTRQHKLTMLR